MLQQRLTTVENADTGRPIQLVTGKYVEITIQRLHINPLVHDRLRTVNQHLQTGSFGLRRNFLHRIDRAQHVGNLSQRQQFGGGIDQSRQLRHIQRTILL
ncbi:hypothetical protein D3C72_1635100 [compost metagenome]